MKTDHDDREHHVIVVDQKDELLFAVWKFRRDFQDEIFRLRLERCQQTIGSFIGEILVQSDDGSSELSIPTSYLEKQKR